jgi:hypothetical protein
MDYVDHDDLSERERERVQGGEMASFLLNGFL